MRYCRLKKYKDFNKIFRNGKRVYSSAATLVYRPSRVTEMGIALSKKYGHAVVRNRIKRLVREAFSATMDDLEGTYSIVVIPRMADSYTLEGFEKGLRSCFRKINEDSGKG